MSLYFFPRGISLPGFFKKKPSRDRASTAPSSEPASTSWYTNNGKEFLKLSDALIAGQVILLLSLVYGIF